MNMERSIITIGESGNIIMPNNTTDIWMSEPELVELFGRLEYATAYLAVDTFNWLL